MLANVSIMEADHIRNGSSLSIDCPGDMISYNCSIYSNSKAVHLTWRVTLPGLMPISITYDNSSEPNNEHMLHPFEFITTVLTEYRSEAYVVSTLLLMVQADIPTDQTLLECYIGDLAYDMVTTVVSIRGVHCNVLLNIVTYILHANSKSCSGPCRRHRQSGFCGTRPFMTLNLESCTYFASDITGQIEGGGKGVREMERRQRREGS